ncbi:hypothetical protein MRX96_000342 [Rhipicephalus microplus]
MAVSKERTRTWSQTANANQVAHAYAVCVLSTRRQTRVCGDRTALQLIYHFCYPLAQWRRDTRRFLSTADNNTLHGVFVSRKSPMGAYGSVRSGSCGFIDHINRGTKASEGCSSAWWPIFCTTDGQ